MKIAASTDSDKLGLLEVPEQGASADTLTYFGMAYPDGKIKWGYDEESRGNIAFAELASKNGLAMNNWRDRLEVRARRANIDFEKYVTEHRLLKRSITVVIGEMEEY